jgi:hypothetical protein
MIYITNAAIERWLLVPDAMEVSGGGMVGWAPKSVLFPISDTNFTHDILLFLHCYIACFLVR